ncbi:flavodoxin FldB [Echinimonas agarilytica]|uniref:Flavodoxin n=1 Tax=Echinimonas agarilytica TaxID=1215918 RepID=A0AA41WAM6_9GAMM|nr:flavodoxin FldB [Echinimonas agarilytica]MCM2681332.1 flavodoxin FldB [Echinimonas agarilytica]
MKIGLFYASSTCYTEMAAEKIQRQLGEELVELHNIANESLALTANYDVLIFGISTWDYGELQEDWESQWADVATLQLAGKIVALYGMGDQEGYADWFQDALGMLHEAIEHPEVARIGFWPNGDDYQFNASKALTPDNSQFVGLALDDEGQFERSDQRIEDWCDQLLNELESWAEQQ